MRQAALASSLLCLGTAILLTACGPGRQAAQPDHDPAAVPMPAAGLAALPAPSQLFRSAAATEAEIRRQGAAFDAALAPRHAAVNGTGLDFAPDFAPGAADSSGLAYALYRFDAGTFLGSPTLRSGWGAAPESGTAWVGLGHQASDRWVWHSLPASQRIQLPGGTTPYTAAGGDFLAIVAVTGVANPCTLAYIRLGNEPPLASLDANPASGPLPLMVTFDFSGVDPDGTPALYSLDFGDGGAPHDVTAPGSIQHSYAVMGTYAALLTVSDSEGATATASVQIDAGVVPNAPPTAVLDISAGNALPGDTIDFDASASGDSDGTIAKYEYDPEGDGTYLFNIFFPNGAPQISYIYSQPGTYQPTVRITDDDGAKSTASQSISVSYGTLAAPATLDSTSGSGAYCSIGVAAGKLCVAYQHGGQLAFVRATGPGAGNWFSPQLLDTMGIGCSLAIIAGNPAIAYHGNGDILKYRRSNDTSGAAWASPFTAMSGATQIGVYPALADIGGNPAIVCSDGSALFSGVSWYARSTNSTGTVWGAKRQISAAGQTGLSSSLLALASGAPCAGIMRVSGTDTVELQFAPAADVLGTAWDPPIPLVTANAILGLSGGLRLVNGRPAMAYYDKTAGKVQFVRAKDSAGLEWNAPVEVAATQQGGGFLSMAIVNGLPVIAYLDGGVGLQLRTATTMLGSAWNPPLLIDAAASSGPVYVSLTEFNSRPAVAYVSASTLKFARWN